MFGVHKVRQTTSQAFIVLVECGKQKVNFKILQGSGGNSFGLRASIFLSLNLRVPIKFCLFQVLQSKNAMESVDTRGKELEDFKENWNQSPDL